MSRMHELDDNERAALSLLIQEAPTALSLEEVGAELGEPYEAEDALGGLLRRNLVHHIEHAYWTATRPATYLAQLDDGLPRHVLDLLLHAAPAPLTLKEVATESGQPISIISDPLDQLERRGAIHRDPEDRFRPTLACRRLNELIGIGTFLTDRHT